MLTDIKIPKEIFELSAELDFYLGADFSIFLRLYHREVKNIHFFSPNFVPEIKFSRIKNIFLSFSSIEMKIFRFEDYKIYFIRYPYETISKSNILLYDFFVKVQSVYDDFCLKMNMALNSRDKREFLENITDIYCILSYVKEFDFQTYYVRKYGFEFDKDMMEEIRKGLALINQEDIEDFLLSSKLYFSFDFSEISVRILKFLNSLYSAG